MSGSPRRLMHLVALAVLGGAAPFGFASCGQGATSSDSAMPPSTVPPSAIAEGTTVVHARNQAFEPATVTVTAGTTVAWEFDDGAIPHNVVGDGFRSSTQRAGVYTHRFAAAGTYKYICTLHPRMRGKVIVE